MTASQSFSQKLYEAAAAATHARRRRWRRQTTARRTTTRSSTPRSSTTRRCVTEPDVADRSTIRPRPPSPTFSPMRTRADGEADGRRRRLRPRPRSSSRARRVPRRRSSGCRPTSRTTASKRRSAPATRSTAPTGALVEELLPVLDACDAARRATAPTDVEPIWRCCSARSRRRASSRIDPDGEPFDPEPARGGHARARRRRRRAVVVRESCAPATRGRAGCCARPW